VKDDGHTFVSDGVVDEQGLKLVNRNVSGIDDVTSFVLVWESTINDQITIKILVLAVGKSIN